MKKNEREMKKNLQEMKTNQIERAIPFLFIFVFISFSFRIQSFFFLLIFSSPFLLSNSLFS